MGFRVLPRRCVRRLRRVPGGARGCQAAGARATP